MADDMDVKGMERMKEMTVASMAIDANVQSNKHKRRGPSMLDIMNGRTKFMSKVRHVKSSGKYTSLKSSKSKETKPSSTSIMKAISEPSTKNKYDVPMPKFNAHRKIAKGLNNTKGAKGKKSKRTSNEVMEVTCWTKKIQMKPLTTKIEAVRTLSTDQYNLVKLILQAEHDVVFITGSGGVGKTFVISILNKIFDLRNVPHTVLATTGRAAVSLREKPFGVDQSFTVNSYLGLGLGDRTFEEIRDHVKESVRLQNNWRGIQVLIIDEISMLSGEHLELIDKVGRSVREEPLKPFGGIKVIFSGDFLQLPPVGNVTLAFQHPIWEKLNVKTIPLTQPHRQKNRHWFNLLTRLRFGALKDADVGLLKTRWNAKWEDDVKPTRIFPHNYSADRVNKLELKNLMDDTEGVFRYEMVVCLSYLNTENNWVPSYNVMISNMDPKDAKDELGSNKKPNQAINKVSNKNPLCSWKDAVVQETTMVTDLILTVGAQVMLTTNLDVASRLSNGTRGVVKSFRNQGGLMCPVVNFPDIGDCVIGQHIHTFNKLNSKKKKGSAQKILSAVQLPLTLAWATSIHKAQGMSLDRLEVPITRDFFENNQLFVALSRVRSLEGLSIPRKGFSLSAYKTNRDAVAWYKKVYADNGLVIEGLEEEKEDKSMDNSKKNMKKSKRKIKKDNILSLESNSESSTASSDTLNDGHDVTKRISLHKSKKPIHSKLKAHKRKRKDGDSKGSKRKIENVDEKELEISLEHFKMGICFEDDNVFQFRDKKNVPFESVDVFLNGEVTCEFQGTLIGDCPDWDCINDFRFYIKSFQTRSELFKKYEKKVITLFHNNQKVIHEHFYKELHSYANENIPWLKTMKRHNRTTLVFAPDSEIRIHIGLTYS